MKVKRMEKAFKRADHATAASSHVANQLGDGWIVLEPVHIAGVGWIPRVTSVVYDICLWHSQKNNGWIFCGLKDNFGNPFDTKVTVVYVETDEDVADTFVSFKAMMRFIEKEFAAEEMNKNDQQT
jgi:hypothetical protein